MIKYFSLLSLLLYLSGEMYAQRTEVYAPHIQTVQVIANDNYLAPPIITLGRGENIEISFDELSHEYHRYQYVISHCNIDWTPSDLSELDYLDGFNNNPIDDYETSINTTMPYTHYKFRLPNNQVRMTLSGNYTVTVYDDSDSDTPIFKTCFRVLEQHVGISAVVSSDTEIDRNKSHQQVSFNIQHKGYVIRNPQQEIKIQVMQNGRVDNMVSNISPTYVGPDELRYTHNRALIFPAGNEYRRFEIVSTRFSNLGVESLQFHDPYYHATLFTSEPRIRNYTYDEDQNGHFLVRYDDATDNDIEADYFFVHFTLPWDKPFQGGNLYLEGEFTYDTFNQQNEMKYNEETSSYESVQLLKQGAYNYLYLYVPDGSTKGETGPVEGNFYETENEYLILVYSRPFGERYDKLIGMKLVRYRP